ncbi:protein bric-a-brac 1 isoform X2 [Drosophila innubila]|uniref:protein bric-a-brac 1 isoform X2 n=1 Tax=Drosophila innubila TaxID=198719 RepID=UPI00148DE5E5|nr:protein bric-a-brac 1 isoform X2 [Drosophila innubila]
MATTQQYSLRWNNYLRHLTYSLDNHRLNDDFVDVSLCVDGRKIKAHKVVLSSCSSYFKEIFKENPHPHPVIIFKFIKFEDLNSIVEFMYQGEVNVQQEALQSFLQTAELLAVQGLTAEEKEKPQLPVAPLISEHKLIKTIPSTIRAVNEQQQHHHQQQQQQQHHQQQQQQQQVAVATVGQAQSATQTIEIPTATLLQATATQVQTQVAAVAAAQLQVQQSQHQHQQQQQQQQHHHVQSTQIQHIQVQAAPPQQQQQQQQQQQPQQQQQQQQVAAQAQHLTITNTVSLPTANNVKKRKITFSDDDDNIYTTETVDYAVKDEQTIVKTAEMTFLRGAVKMDIPDYIVSEVDDRLSDGATPQTSQDATTGAAQTVAQYSSEYEILTESEIEEKYQADPDNAEIAIEMTRLLGTASGATTTTTAQAVLEDAGAVTTGGTTTVSVTPVKTDNKASGTNDSPNNKWTECQFCKMVITTVNLWRHIRTQHTPQPPRKCELCNKNFKNKYSLREHIRISHEQKVAIKTEN